MRRTSPTTSAKLQFIDVNQSVTFLCLSLRRDARRPWLSGDGTLLACADELIVTAQVILRG
jgi:hypothetical protein